IAGGRRVLVVPDVVGVAIAELTIASVAPTAQPSPFDDRARVAVADGDVDDGCADIHIAHACRRFVVADVVETTVPERAMRVVSPAADSPPRQDYARMVRADRELDDRS